ncbi:MFS transporter [Pseudomonas sp. M30-35]|uniref:MFS transporter n=1 Tax=Pseudomonas sp. M30-35 TaxID=1981174 RepID=UPI001C48888E|nr:MFS transporter [Pseudomonas sp. M30-35]
MMYTAQTPSPAGVRKAVIASIVGTIIEWFDYALYGTAASLILNKIFFPDLSDTASVLAAFATFAVGFFVRPLGGVVIAHLGDRFGRKPALIFSISLMGAGTVAIGLLPTYAQIGIMAPILLVLMRMVQGFGAGAEYAGAVTLVYEYAPPQQRGFYTSMLQSATLVGILLAVLTFLGVSQLSEEALSSWGWRLPFLSSAVLFVVALYIRQQLDETPEYLQAAERAKALKETHKLPLKTLLKRYPKQLTYGFLAVTGHNANVYILSAFGLSYMTNTLNINRSDALWISLLASFCGVLTTPLMGWLADRLGASKIYIFGAGFAALFAYPLFALIDSGNLLLATIGLCLGFSISFGAMAGAQGLLLADLFPTELRFSGISVARELNSMLIAGPTPFICTLLVGWAAGSSTYVSAYLALCCIVSIFAVVKLRSEQPIIGRNFTEGNESTKLSRP